MSWSKADSKNVISSYHARHYQPEIKIGKEA